MRRRDLSRKRRRRAGERGPFTTPAGAGTRPLHCEPWPCYVTSMSWIPTKSSIIIGLAALLALADGPAVAMVGQTRTESRPQSTVMLLRHVGDKAGFCTGVALARDVVLTAAHCVPKGAELRVLLPGDPGQARDGAGGRPVASPGLSCRRDPAARGVDRPGAPSSCEPPARQHHGGGPRDVRRRENRGAVRRVGLRARPRRRCGDLGHLAQRDAPPPVRRSPSCCCGPTIPTGGGAGACTGDSGGPVSAEGSDEVSAIMLWSAGAAARHCGSLTQAIWLAPQKAWIDRVMLAWHPASQAAPSQP